MKKPVPMLSANLLGRIADPGSRFYPDYCAYQNREISWPELVSRLPHVAMIGDSVCTGVHVSSVLSTFWRARTCCGQNWFLDTDPSPTSIRSVSRRLEELSPIVATEYAGIGALVDHEDQPQNFFRRILRTRNFSGQIDQLLAAERFPDLVLIAIGHNNVDWAWRSPPSELEQPEKRLQRQSRHFRDNFARQMRRVIECGRRQHHRVAVVVYGLINFGAYFKGREIAERLRTQDPARYPHLETTYKYFISFRPVYRSNLIRLAEMVNEELRTVVSDLNRDLADNGSLQVRYSDALATADLSRAELLHPVDGWHASVEGHNVLAEAAFSDLGPSLEFLGIT